MGKGITTGAEDLYSEWLKLLQHDKEKWDKALQISKNGPDILIATCTGGHIPMSIMESVLSVALTLRGAKIHVLLCDKFLPACLMAEKGKDMEELSYDYQGNNKAYCKRCFGIISKLYKEMGLIVYRFSDFIGASEIEEINSFADSYPAEQIPDYKENGICIGEHSYAGTLRYFARGDLDGEEFSELMLKRYFKSSLITKRVIGKILNNIDFTAVCFHHGIYVPQGVIGEVARKKNVRVVNWNPAYRKQRFIFSHDNSYHYAMMDEPVSDWEDIKWTPSLEQVTMDYLKSREKGSNDWIWFNKNPNLISSDLKKKMNIDESKTCIGMLTNVVWDAQLHYRQNAFRNIIDWAEKTISYFTKKPELNLIIRIHPAEITGGRPSRQLFADEINKRFKDLPSNIIIVPPENNLSTYSLMDLCNAVIIYGTKTGIELTCRGIPTIVAGEAWIRNKGLTVDVESEEDYFEILKNLPVKEKICDEVVERARKYAFHFFFRRMIPFQFIKPYDGAPFYKFDLASIDDLNAGMDKGLDLVCDGILKNNPFIYPAEEIYLTGDLPEDEACI